MLTFSSKLHLYVNSYFLEIRFRKFNLLLAHEDLWLCASSLSLISVCPFFGVRERITDWFLTCRPVLPWVCRITFPVWEQRLFTGELTFIEFPRWLSTIFVIITYLRAPFREAQAKTLSWSGHVRWKTTDVSEETSIKQVANRTRFRLATSLFFDH
jgi:hypothetical protein